MILVDTTVLVYAAGADHPLRAPCRGLVDLTRRGRLRASTTVEVIQEFVHVRARRRSRENAAEFARRYADLFAPLVPVDLDDLRRGLALFEDHQQVGAFDSVLAACAVRNAAGLVSTDGGFGAVPGLRHLNPSAPGFLAALES